MFGACQTCPTSRVIDIGTGSGNLAVAIAKHLPGAAVTAVDISGDALAVARRNARNTGLRTASRSCRATFLRRSPREEPFDFVISNPPYIPTFELPGLPPGVRDFEPHLALDGGPDGYQVFERLVCAAAPLLKPGGWLIVEIGAPQETAARQLLTAHGGYELAPTLYDYAGHPRVLKARRV